MILKARGVKLQGIRISMNVQTINLEITENTSEYNVFNEVLNTGWNQTNLLIVNVTIQENVFVYSTDTSNYAFVASSDPIWDNKLKELNLINNGFIVGKGGDGGNGGTWSQSGSNGSDGGPALNVQIPMNIDNLGTIAGGGGGGGGGGSARRYVNNNSSNWHAVGGGGGGGGAGISFGGTRGNNSGNASGGSMSTLETGQNGSNGTLTAHGDGGNRWRRVYTTSSGTWTATGGNGGNGGGYGQNGNNGDSGSSPNGTRSGGSGGSAGDAVVGNSFITWINEGIRLGNIN